MTDWAAGAPRSRRPDRGRAPGETTEQWRRTAPRQGSANGGPRRGGYADGRAGRRGDDFARNGRAEAVVSAGALVVPDGITADQLDPEVLGELRTLPGDLADAVAKFLVATGLAEDPQQAYRYARQARDLAARVGVVRETCAIAAYQAEDWAGALAEFRAARRLTGRTTYLPLMADCERALGRLDRALDLVTGADARGAEPATRIELRIVESGIRRDQGLPEASVAALHGSELEDPRTRPEFARLYYAYADALLHAGREEEALDWFGRAARADVDEETDAAERYEELDEFSFDDLADEDAPDPSDDSEPDSDS